MISLYYLDFRARDVGGPVVGPLLYDEAGRLMALSELDRLRDGRVISFVVHGFNVCRLAARSSIGSFADLMRTADPDTDAIVVAVLWPGDGLLSPLTYSLEERDADATARRLADLITRTLAGSRISFIAHSLGCRVALETMRLLGSDAPVESAVLFAGAVDADALARTSRYREAVKAAGTVAVVASRVDYVLKYAFPLGDAVAAILFGGYTTAALGYNGPARARSPAEGVPGEVAPHDATALSVGHGDYLPGPIPTQLHQRAAAFAATVVQGGRPSAY